MKRIAVVLVGCLGSIVLATRPAGAVCKMIINVDRTASMTLPASSGTRCTSSQNLLIAILDAYWLGMDYDITQLPRGAEESTRMNRDCPCNASTGSFCTDSLGQRPDVTQGTRLVQVWEFHGDTMQPLWTDGEDGFISIGEAITRVNALGWYNANRESVGDCPGPTTPMAQAMCRAARKFPLIANTPLGQVSIIKTLTDGEENWSHIVPIDTAANEARCREPTDLGDEWRTRVQGVYDERDVVHDAVLWGGFQELTATASAGEPNGEALGRARATAGSSLAASPDEEFFLRLAEATGGTFRFIDLTTPISPEVTLVDSDGDGIPDFRDRCVGDCADDRDHDGIPDASDACRLLAEDGRSPFRSDGCPDADFDGVRDDVDRCRTEADDHLAPFPSDGCAAAHWSASATPNLPFRGLVCTSRFVVSPTGAASRAKLSIAGSHSSRAGLRGVLFHNLDPAEAFPVGTFPAGAGSFSFTDRPVAAAPSSATGLWTLCITDTNGFGASGVLNSWSIHD
jgi:hypothetical protein